MPFLRALTLDTKVTLNNGVEIPIFGLGTFQTQADKETPNAVLYALEAGYWHVDTAEAYGNVVDVGIALMKSGIAREEIFITTKVWNSNQGYKSTLAACNASLEKLEIAYIDFNLIHWPVEGQRNETWRALKYLLEEGKTRAIGVSNYMIWHLKELLVQSSTIPTINQVEFSLYIYQEDLLDFCRSNKIILEAYSPLNTKSIKNAGC